MSDNYTKLFSSITESTIWGEPAGTRLVWITFLAKCNKHGEVFGSVPGFARLSNVTIDECEQAIATLLAPDKWSRTPDNEGRRIETIDGGWRILNHAKFDAIRGQLERADYKRRWDKENRGNRPNSKNRKPPTTPDNSDTTPTVPTPPVTSHQSEKKEQKKKHAPSGVDLLAGIDPNIARDFKALRGRQHAPITETAMKGIAREAGKAGMSVEDALRTCCENSWRGFKADWLKGKPNGRATQYQPLPGEM